MARLTPLAALLALLLLAAPALARPGDVDTSFGDRGEALLRSDRYAGMRGLTQLPDGGLLVAYTHHPGGGVGHVSVARFHPDGRLDRTFGDAGHALTPLAWTPIEPLVTDAGILLVGQEPRAPEQRVAVVRLRHDGGLDTSFGDAGVVTIARSVAQGAFLQPDGRLVVLGSTFRFDWPHQPAAIRLLPDGSVDGSFGGEGGWARLAERPWEGYPAAGFAQPDGRLVIVTEVNRTDGVAHDRINLIRVERDGSPDESYGNGGSTGFFGGPTGRFGGLAVQPDGKVVIAGRTGVQPWPYAVARANPDGTADSGFGDGGQVVIRPPGGDPANPPDLTAEDVVVQSDGKLVVSGTAPPPRGLDPRAFSTWGIARLLPGGALDPGFGDGGWSMWSVGVGGRVPGGLVRTPEGKVVVGGDAGDCGEGVMALVRLHAENAEAGGDRGPTMRTCGDSTIESERDGDLPIEVQCPLAEELCRGTATITIPSNRLRVGARSFRLRGSETRTLEIRASRRARRHIARPRGVRAELVYTTKDADGNRAVTRRKLRLKRP